MIKRFAEWIKLKQKLHEYKHESPLVKERDLWWFSVGENIGSEINGKSDLFSRPGLILKKLSRGLYLLAPTTTQPKEGSWYVAFTHSDKQMYVCLHQVRIVDHRRLSTRIGQVDTADFARVKEGFWKLYR